MNKNQIDFSKVDNVSVVNIDTKDYPDFCDAFIESADINGVEATEEELELINNNTDFVYEEIEKVLY